MSLVDNLRLLPWRMNLRASCMKKSTDCSLNRNINWLELEWLIIIIDLPVQFPLFCS